MKKNQHVDLFKEIIPSIDLGIKDLWDASSDEGKKEIKNDLWRLNRFISSVNINDREIQEFFLCMVNEYYNKNWNDISKDPKLQWLTLCLCSHESKKKFFHEYIPLKKNLDRKEEILLKLFPQMKSADAATLAAITTDKEIKQYCEDLGWDEKEIDGLKL